MSNARVFILRVSASFCRVVTETIRTEPTRPGLALNTRLVPLILGLRAGSLPALWLVSTWQDWSLIGCWRHYDLCTELTWTWSWDPGVWAGHMELHPAWCKSNPVIDQGSSAVLQLQRWMNVKLWMKYVQWIVEYTHQYWINAWSCKWMTDVCVLRSQQPHYHTIMRANDSAVNLLCLLASTK